MAFSFTGPLPPREHTAEQVPALLDIDSPLRTGIVSTTSGDVALSGELATYEKAVWAAVLTPVGTVQHRPDFGTLFDLKRLRPADLSKAQESLVSMVMSVPGTYSVAVQITWEGDECFVAFDCNTDFGPFYSKKAVRRAS